MAKRTNFGFEKRQKEKAKQEKAARKREKRLDRTDDGDIAEGTPGDDAGTPDGAPSEPDPGA